MASWKDKLGAAFGVEAPEEPPPKKFSYQPKKNNPPKKSSTATATAPYNFVALPEKILPAEFENFADFAEHIGTNGNISGEISLELETLTPLFIGGGGTKSFAPVDKPIIPGSSLRGMFKNIFKIVTCGAFRGRTTSQRKGEDFNDEHIYYRCLMTTKNSPAWMDDLHELYKDRMIHDERGKDGKFHPVKNARPGFLIRTTDNKFFIAPSIYKSDRKDDRILILDYEKKFNVTVPERNSSCVKWDNDIAYIITGSQARFKLLDAKAYEKISGNDKKRAGKQFIRFTRLKYVDWCRDHWFALPEDVRTSYEHDRNRRGVNLLDEKNKGNLKRADLERLTGKKFPDVKTLIPCHFLEENGQVTAFGHGQCFRIPYRKKIGDAVAKALQSEKIIDFADAVFGKEKFWASRVYFEDATTENFDELPTAKAHPLMQPNPTSYQLYLKQSGDKLKHWDTSGAQIRGYKLYWHKPATDWQANQDELLENDKRLRNKQEPLTKDMSPLREGCFFRSKIRFKNLSVVELGALMMIFDLDGLKDAAYKIGQGKPLGFGSIKITPKLYIETDNAYTELFGADGWQSPCREKNSAEYLAAFRKYLTACGMSDAWKNIMDELKIILDCSRMNQPKWSAQVKSMSGNVAQKDGVDDRFKQRAPLPPIKSIFEVVK